jgi:16S rRNA (uracil1498-N3)-methyltransferase
MIRLYVDVDLAEGREIALPDAQARYLVQVMRRGPGDEVLVFNGRDGEWGARIVAAGKRATTLEVVDQTRVQPPPSGIVLVMALVKRTPLETVIAKSVELGVSEIRLVTTERTNADHTRIDRLEAIATEAAEQTGRLDVPRIHAPEPLVRVLDAQPGGGRLIFCDEAGDAPPLLEILGGQAAGALAVLIGPEGGFSASERAGLRSRNGVIAVSLGPRILRADTAALSALTLVQAVLGDWRT